MHPLTVVLVVILLLLLVGGLPATGWHQLGYWPSGTAGLLLLILLILLLLGRI